MSWGGYENWLQDQGNGNVSLSIPTPEIMAGDFTTDDPDDRHLARTASSRALLLRGERHRHLVRRFGRNVIPTAGHRRHEGWAIRPATDGASLGGRSYPRMMGKSSSGSLIPARRPWRRSGPRRPHHSARPRRLQLLPARDERRQRMDLSCPRRLPNGRQHEDLCELEQAYATGLAGTIGEHLYWTPGDPSRIRAAASKCPTRAWPGT